MKFAHQLIMDAIVGLIILIVLAAIGIKPAANNTPVNITMIGAAAAPDVQATIYGAEWCGQCHQYVDAINAEMHKDGWIIRKSTDKDAATAHIVINKEDSNALNYLNRITGYPTTIIRKHGKEVNRFRGGLSPDQLAKAINDAAKGP